MIYCKTYCKWGTTCNVASGHDFKVEECKFIEPVAKKTNGDKIRSMTDEELAEWLEDRTMLPINGLWLDWLKQEVK